MEKENLSRTTPAFLLAASVFLAAGAAHALQITSLTPQGEVSRVRQMVAKFDQPRCASATPSAGPAGGRLRRRRSRQGQRPLDR